MSRLNYCKTFIKVHTQGDQCDPTEVPDVAGKGVAGPGLIIWNNFQMRNAQFNNFMCKRGNFLSGTANCLCECDKTLYTTCVCVWERVCSIHRHKNDVELLTFCAPNWPINITKKLSDAFYGLSGERGCCKGGGKRCVCAGVKGLQR